MSPTSTANKVNIEKVNNILLRFLDENTVPTFIIKQNDISLEELHLLTTEIENLFERTYGENDEASKKLELCLCDLREYLQELAKDESDSVKIGQLQTNEIEPQQTFQVCSSNLYNRNLTHSEWSPKCLVGCNISYTKAYELGPKVDDPTQSGVNMIYKYKGLTSTCNPICIPVNPSEFSEFVNGAIIMFTLFQNTNLPIKLKGIESCKKLLSEVKKDSDWDDIGNMILESFELTPKNVGQIFKSHMTNMVNSKIMVDEDGLTTKTSKRKNQEQFNFDAWIARQKRFAVNSKKKQAEAAVKESG